MSRSIEIKIVNSVENLSEMINFIKNSRKNLIGFIINNLSKIVRICMVNQYLPKINLDKNKHSFISNSKYQKKKKNKIAYHALIKIEAGGKFTFVSSAFEALIKMM